MPRVQQIFSEAGMGKSTYALGRVKLTPNGEPISKSKLKTLYCEFDPGSFARAEAGMKLDYKRLTVKQYRTPFTSLEDFGKLSTSTVGASGNGAVQIVHRLSGWAEEYWKYISELLSELKTGDYDTVVTDTIKREWDMAQNAFRQRIQDETQVDRERLTRLEYQEPNAQHYQIRDACATYGADWILLTHEGEVWKDGKPTGQPKADGWNDASKISDVTLRFTLRAIGGKLTPVASVFKLGGADLSMIGREFEAPTLDSVSEIMNAAAVLQREGVAIPASNKDIIEMAKSLVES